jgi:hypothetical protein
MQTEPDLYMQIRQLLARFNDLVAARSMLVLDEFASDEGLPEHRAPQHMMLRDHVLLIGSEAGEVAQGRPELEAFFTRVFAREVAFSWEWERLEADQAGDIAWFFAEGQVVLTSAQEQRKAPYRVSGVVERHAGRWLWRQYHGSEPVGG